MNNPQTETVTPALREPIPGYTLLERIGTGGCGEVWKADAPGGMLKAIKLVYGNADESRAVNERNSLNRMKDVRHPFLISIERIEEIQGHLLIVTELAESSLQDRFEQCKQLGQPGIPRQELLEYLRDTADALDFLYERFFFQHLDVKPENLLLVGNRIKVADFGLVTDVRTTAASLTGGLTPLYAAPEVFDGRPSPTSDQYSLAIVFQQLLTGHAPFNGRTAAQLAAQHLQIKPQLTHLPPRDRQAIAKALSKDPTQRFSSCREFVQALTLTPAASDLKSSFVPASDVVDISQPAMANKSNAANASEQLDTVGHPFQQGSVEDGVTPTAEVMENVSQTISLGEEYLREISSQSTQHGEITNLPPLPESNSPTHFQPTLIVGIGGAAGQVLKRYRQRLLDRYENIDAIKSWQTILIDTDSSALRNSVQEKSNVGLKDRDVLAIPLRRPEEYRPMSSKLLSWMSRRWLYNIPRSLQTEGIRPLGRLAFVDHYDRIRLRFQSALQLMIDEESLVESEQAAKNHFFPVTPRVVVLAATSGGTGGGMVLDIAASLRQILQERGFADAQILGLLMHATERRVGTQGLAIANSYAALQELYHYNHSAVGYPGDQACSLEPLPRNTRLFDQQYAVHLGNDLNDKEFATAIDSVAEYLYLDTATPIGEFFQRSRQHKTEQPSDPTFAEQASVRSFAIKQLGGSNSQVPNAVAELLCIHLLQTWRGTATAVKEDSIVNLSDVNALLAAHGATHEVPSGEVEELVSKHVEHFAIEPLLAHAYETIRSEVGMELDEYLRNIFRQTKATDSDKKLNSAHLLASKILETIDAIVGAQATEEETLAGGPPSLSTILADRMTTLANQQGDDLQKWVLEYADQNDRKIKGAQQCIDGCLDHIRELEKSLTELVQQYRSHMGELRQMLCQQEQGESAGRDQAGSSTTRSNRSKPATETAWMEYTQTRLHIVVLRSVGLQLRIIRGKLTFASDSLRDLWKDLHQMEREFSAKPVGATEDDSLAEMLWRNREQLIAQIDQEISPALAPQENRLRHFISVGQELRNKLITQLRAASRRVTLRALKSLNTRVAPQNATEVESENDESLAAELSNLQPRLIENGGAQRLLIILPEGSDASEVQASLSGTQDPNVMIDTDGDIVLCREAEQISLTQVARSLVKGHPQSLKAASQLHTRTDVAWTDFV